MHGLVEEFNIHIGKYLTDLTSKVANFNVVRTYKVTKIMGKCICLYMWCGEDEVLYYYLDVFGRVCPAPSWFHLVLHYVQAVHARAEPPPLDVQRHGLQPRLRGLGHILYQCLSPPLTAPRTRPGTVRYIGVFVQFN